MLRLRDYQEYNKSPDLSYLHPSDNYFLSALGARVCYSSTNDFLNLWFDPKVIDVNEREKFLSRLAKAGHYSVFAHSPVEFSTAYTEEYRCLYKAWIYGENVCLNGRHIVENTGVPYIGERDAFEPVIFFYDLDKGIGFVAEDITDLSSFTNLPRYLVGIHIPGFFGWYSFLMFGISRACANQWVRHTWQNFSQRSHRYTKVDGFVYPESLGTVSIGQGKTRISGMLLAQETVRNCQAAYEILTSNNVPKEDARYIMPIGAKTTLMASGPGFVWEDFVEKRIVKGVQWEIKECAKAIKRFLEETGYYGEEKREDPL